jgi:hypothetical protein
MNSPFGTAVSGINHDLLILQRAQLRGQHTDVSHLADGLVGLDPVSG